MTYTDIVLGFTAGMLITIWFVGRWMRRLSLKLPDIEYWAYMAYARVSGEDGTERGKEIGKTEETRRPPNLP